MIYRHYPTFNIT